MIEETMSITAIIFVLVILLFGFDSAEQVNPAGNTITANSRTRDVRVHEIPIFENLRKK